MTNSQTKEDNMNGEMRLATLRRELGEDILNSHVNEKFNSTESEVDAEGSMWISNPQVGHWASDDKINEFLDWLDNELAN
jgi:hypothetical protein